MPKLQFQSTQDGPLWKQVTRLANELLKLKSSSNTAQAQMHYFEEGKEWELMQYAMIAQDKIKFTTSFTDEHLTPSLETLHHWCYAHGVTSAEKAFKATWSHEKILRLAIIGEMRKFVGIRPKEESALELLDNRIKFYKDIHTLDIKKGMVGENEMQCLIGIENELIKIRKICQSIRDSLRCAELYDRIAVKLELLAYKTQQLMFATREETAMKGNYNEIQMRRSKDGVGALAILSYSLGKRFLEATNDTKQFLNFSRGYLPVSKSKIWYVGSEDVVEDEAFRFVTQQRLKLVTQEEKSEENHAKEHIQLCMSTSLSWVSPAYKHDVVLMATKLVPHMLKTFNAAKTMKISRILVSLGGERIFKQHEDNAVSILVGTTNDLNSYKDFCAESSHWLDTKRLNHGLIKSKFNTSHLSKLSAMFGDVAFYIQSVIAEVAVLQAMIEQVSKFGNNEFNDEKEKLEDCLKLRRALDSGSNPVNEIISLENKALPMPEVHQA
ncbi:hypothetical protein HDU79_010041 [Rhizoclosmatium sp. JEL0117]|nr:hypothetical protein HDU79_010041 [Rhizoclosmatium sp. JEL0117]